MTGTTACMLKEGSMGGSWKETSLQRREERGEGEGGERGGGRGGGGVESEHCEMRASASQNMRYTLHTVDSLLECTDKYMCTDTFANAHAWIKCERERRREVGREGGRLTAPWRG